MSSSINANVRLFIDIEIRNFTCYLTKTSEDFTLFWKCGKRNRHKDVFLYIVGSKVLECSRVVLLQVKRRGETSPRKWLKYTFPPIIFGSQLGHQVSILFSPLVDPKAKKWLYQKT
jgi:hypothetical protein